MDERELSSVLEEIAGEVDVSPVPLHEIRSQRPSWRAPAAAAAAVVVLAGIGVGVGLLAGGEPERAVPAPDVAAPTKGAPTDVAPGARLRGLGHVAIEVPARWATNDLKCGTPQSNTLIIDQSRMCLAQFPRPAGVETIRIEHGMNDREGEQMHAETFLGAPASRWVTECGEVPGGGESCTARVWLRGADDVGFTAEAATRERAEDLLSTIRRVPDLVGLPGVEEYAMSNASGSEPYSPAFIQDYADHLRALGFEPVVRTMPGGNVLPGQTSPEPGTMLPAGATVSVWAVP